MSATEKIAPRIERASFAERLGAAAPILLTPVMALAGFLLEIVGPAAAFIDKIAA